jgi:hypothetical protein
MKLQRILQKQNVKACSVQQAEDKFHWEKLF